jgi:hypothetical protein
MRRWGAACGALAFLATACGESPDRPRVLGVSLVATTTTTATDAPPAPTATATATPIAGTSIATTTEPAPSTTGTRPAPAATASTTRPPRPATTTTTTTPPGESFAPGTYVEPTDTHNAATVDEDGAVHTSSMSITRRDAPERADVTVMYYGRSVEVQLTNLADRAIVLPDGYRALVECTHDGQPWRAADAINEAVTHLEPHATASALVDLPAEGPGDYTCSATVEIVLP